LIHLLEVQQTNLQRAQEKFEAVSQVLEIKAPNLGSIHLHLGGKRDRIDLIYSSASDVMHRLKVESRPWEVSQPLPGPRSIEDVLAENSGQGALRHKLSIREIPDPSSQELSDFEQLIEKTTELQEFIAKHCRLEDL